MLKILGKIARNDSILTICLEKRHNKRFQRAKANLDSKFLPYQCLICKKGFGEKFMLRRHNADMKKKKAIKCSRCDVLLSSRCSLKRHLLDVHEKKKSMSGSVYSRPELMVVKVINRQTAEKSGLNPNIIESMSGSGYSSPVLIVESV